MAGHSQFANIKHKKEANDKKRGKIFYRLLKELNVAGKKGTNPDTNPALRLVIDKCKASNMPKENIEKALKKIAGKNDNTNYQEITFEGYGPGGIAFVVETLTDNHNRVVSNVKSYFTKTGGSIGTPNSVLYLFETKGVIVIDKTLPEEKVMDVVLENNAIDFDTNEEFYLINTIPNDLLKMIDKLKELGYQSFVVNEVQKTPKEYIDLTEELKRKNEHLINLLEDDEDVQNVYTNINW